MICFNVVILIFLGETRAEMGLAMFSILPLTFYWIESLDLIFPSSTLYAPILKVFCFFFMPCQKKFPYNNSLMLRVVICAHYFQVVGLTNSF